MGIALIRPTNTDLRHNRDYIFPIGRIKDGQIMGNCIHAGPSEIRRSTPFAGKNVRPGTGRTSS
jgi:hypothetical protein